MSPHFDASDRMDYYQPHGRSSLPEAVLGRVKRQERGTLLTFTVWAMDGEQMRLIDVDFTTGGNPARYRYVPNAELWVEQFLPPSDVAPVYVHEAIETILMVRDGMHYEQAHKAANVHEVGIRRAIAEGRITIATYQEALEFAQLYLVQLLSFPRT